MDVYHENPESGLPDPLHGIAMGLGTWAWGDRVVWQFGRGYGASQVRSAFDASIGEGIRFIETSEVYGSGRSERFVGEFLQSTETRLIVATKYFPWPWRLTRSAIRRALAGSLARLRMKQIDLFQVHAAGLNFAAETASQGLVECLESGFTRSVGVSNFDEGQVLRAYSTLARQNVPLRSNEVHFSLLHRRPEKNGLLSRCRELGVTLIACSPLEMGLLTGKYGRAHTPPGSRALRYAGSLGRLQPLLKLMTEIGQDQGGKSNAQVALNWVIAKGAVPIPGAKNAQQAVENAGALGWSLTPAQMAALDALSDQVTGPGD